ncbi:MAG: adenylosuccinate lyase [Acidobacteriota bacterium]
MIELWSEKSKFQAWLDVEIAVSEVLAEMGQVPAEAVKVIKEKATFTVERIREIEEVTRHDVIAFTSAIAENVGPESRWVHLGLTSTDVVDTAQALRVKKASDLIEKEIISFLETLKKRAVEHQHTYMMGRTHGIHAEPTTFGLKLAIWYSEMQRNLERFRHARKNLEVGKISGPVGSFSHLPPEVEERACARLGIGFAAASTQTLQRDRHAEYLCVLAILGGTYDKIATEIRHLQRTEVREVQEAFRKGQKGSSAMPHKRNPITCEQISGLSRILRANSLVALENIPLWHERDISHSSAERVILPDSTTLAHYLSIKINRVIANLVVNREQMLKNIDLMGGLVFSGTLLLELVKKGVLREDAYLWVQRNAMKVWDEGADFLGLILADSDIRKHLTEEEIRRTFDLQEKTKHVDQVFRRVFE